MSVAVEDLEFDLPPSEIPDWGYARNLRAILKRPLAEWSSSVTSVPLIVQACFGDSRLAVPNRDSPYEGLFGIVHRENWKFFDALSFGLYFGNEWLGIEPSLVKVAPWKCSYEYVLNHHEALSKSRIEYYLLSAANKCALRIGISIDPIGTSEPGFLVLEPIVDIRHMYSASIPEGHEVLIRELRENLQMLEVRKDGKCVFIFSDSNRASITPCKRILDWSYKLGNGERIDSPHGIGFRSEQRPLLAPATMSIPIDGNKRQDFHIFVCWGEEQASNYGFDRILNEHIDDELCERKSIECILRSFKPDTRNALLNRAIAARIVALTKFGIWVPEGTHDYACFPEAGAWWFRAVWLRDVYEGLLNNIRTLLNVPGGREFMRKVIIASIPLIDLKSGRIPNKLPEFEYGYEDSSHIQPSETYYNSSDATLLFILFTCRFALETQDQTLGDEIVRISRRIVDSYYSANNDETDGHPILSHDSGLLLTVPSHSWADSCKDVRIGNLLIPAFPLRVPQTWLSQGRDLERILKELHRPNFLLPEINALWIKALEALIQVLNSELLDAISDDMRKRFSEEIELILAKAKHSFKKVFWNEAMGFLYNIVTGDLEKKDTTETSFAIVSLALLDNLFSDDEVKRAWNVVKNTLLVLREPTTLGPRGMKPFGVLVKNSPERVFYDDKQYHEAVLWPRDTPYLVRLLQRLGEVDTIKDILVNNIDHQMTEGAIFFNSELFSLPEGKNPCPSPTSQNPIPVKNPALWWSHWTDLFVSHFCEIDLKQSAR